MGLFDWMRKTEPQVSLPQVCRDMAYDIFPQHVFSDFDSLKTICLKPGDAGAAHFYRLACEARELPAGSEPKDAHFRWHNGSWDGGREYLALQYPQPPELGLSRLAPEQLRKILESGSLVLAPFFSLIAFDRAKGSTRYYVLEQSVHHEETTLREVLPDRIMRLGVGPEPRLSALLEAVVDRRAWRKD